MKNHQYQIDLQWTGNRGQGTRNYRAYDRDHLINANGKTAPIEASSDPAFRGDPQRYNPEELLVASLSSCHMLWSLHLCSTNGIEVIAYEDHPVGTMVEEGAKGVGYFSEVCLHPEVTIAQADKKALAEELHHKAHQLCFIANSCNFPIRHEPKILIATE